MRCEAHNIRTRTIGALDHRRQRRGITIVYMTMMLVVLLGFASLAVDYARVQLSKSELQTASDAAARAAVLQLANSAGQAMGQSYMNTQNTAVTWGGYNKAVNNSVVIDPVNDVIFGIFDTSARTFSPLASSGAAFAGANAVKVTARRTSARGTATPLLFGTFLGASSCDANSTTIAMPGKTVVNYLGGFAGATMSVNGIGYITGSNLRLTDTSNNSDSRSSGWQTTSAWYSTKLNVQQFATTFTFVMQIAATTSGLTFAIQNQGPTAMGTTGQSLGYGGPNGAYNYPITNSLCIKFDPHDSMGEGNDSTGLYTNGANPTTPALDATGTIDLNSSHVFNVQMYYDGSNLYVNICDTNNGYNFGHTYTGVNIPGIVGGNTAYIGFTGAGGTPGGNTDIQKWWYGSGGIVIVK